MLNIQCEEYLAKVREEADKIGMRAKLEEQLAYLDGYAGRDETRCDLYKDFAPLSFGFTMYKKSKSGPFEGEYLRWFNGGCIYYGPTDMGVGEPQLSVRLVAGEAGWSINT
jgi:hypothetical protein